MSHRWLWFSGAGIAFGFGLLAHVPAQLVVPERAGKLQILGVSGSVWRGEIEQVFYSGKALPVRNLNWKVRPAALLAGTLEAEFHEEQAPANRGQVALDLWSQEFELQTVQWRLPGNALDRWFRPGVSLQGQFALDLQTLRLPANGLIPNRVEGRLDWQDAALRMDSETWPVGAPTTQFSGEGYAVKGVITNSQPLLPGDSSFQCTPESCRVELNLQPSPEAPPSLSNVLLFLGLEQSGSRYSGEIILPLD